MFTALLLLMATPVPAASQTAAPAPAAGTTPATGTPEPAPHSSLTQIFIAPSGELFQAPSDAPFPVATWFARADANHDGKLIEAEFDADFLSYFDRLDLDHDGVIDGREVERYETDLAPELQTGAYSGSGGEPVVDENGEAKSRSVGSFLANAPIGAGRFGLLPIPEPVVSMDVELRGRINRAAAQDAASYRFSLLDTQQRGYLLLAELPETYAQKRHIEGGRHHRDGRHREHG